MNDIKTIKNIVASGCSFTSNGTGGLPPSTLHPTGACSFIPDPDYETMEPLSWAGMIAKKLNVKSFVNLAASSHGNILVANNITYLINNFNYNPEDTLILFNLSDPARLDILCDWNDKSKSSRCHWDESILPFGYLDRDSVLVKKVLLTMQDYVEMVTSNAILGMMSFLKYKKFNFYFTVMMDYRDNNYLGPVIEKFKDHFVALEPGTSMYQHTKILNLLSADKLHPNIKGHESISTQVLNRIKHSE